ncbi:MAG: sigma-70 family RNA polymerase sigma factor [Planctomycetes bacterium]|nr:sigma-70 family RNA polymerase sigma factor [Planctomycetota bacterium]
MPDDVLNHLRALRALVVAMLGSESAADDVVQEVWIASRKSRRSRSTSAWGWLRGLARIEVLQRRRRDGRREARERAVAKPEAQLEPETTSERLELARIVLAEVQALEEPYARTIWLHYFEELPPREIAAREGGIPAETVRTRLHRARGLLRQRLEARYGRGDAWRQALAPIAFPFACDVARAAGTFGLTAVTSLMSIKILGSAALMVLLLAAGWYAWPTREDELAPALTSALDEPRVERTGAADEAAPALFARATSPAESEERRQEAAAPTGAGILVLGEGELPLAEVPVALLSRKYDQEVGLWEGSTAENGFIAFPSDWRARVPEHLKDQVVATLAFPVAEPVDAAIDLASALEAPLVLRMPPTGSLEISVVDEQGRFASEVPVVMVSGTSAADLASGRTLWQSLLTTYVPLHEGRGLLPFIGLGCRLQVAFNYRDGSRVRVEVEVDGPTRVGERVPVRIALGERVPVLTGRLLDEDGGILAQKLISLQHAEYLGTIEARSVSTGLETDADGRFRWPAWAGEGPVGDGRSELSFRGRDALADARAFVRIASPPPEEFDLGDIVLRRPPLLVSGIVRVGSAPPNVDVSVEVVLESAPPEQARVSKYAALDAEGRFALREDGSWKRATVQATTSGGNVRSPLRSVVPESAEALALELALPQISIVQGRFLVDEISTGAKLWIHAVDERGKLFAQWVQLGSAEFRFPLPCGKYRFLIDATGRQFHSRDELELGIAPLLDIADLQVREAPITEDPRLASIDLRGRFRKLRARVLDEHGEPIRRSRDMRLAPLTAKGPAGAYGIETDRDGHFEAICLSEHGSFLLSHAGYAPLALRWKAEEQTLRLEPGFLVELELGLDAPKIEAPFELFVVLDPLRLPTADLGSAIGTQRDFRASMATGRGALRVPCPGTYRLEWMLELSPNGHGTWANHGPTARQLEIVESSTPQRFVVTPHAETVERAKRQLLQGR